MNIDNDVASAIKFVRCHFLDRKNAEPRSTIIVRFESFRDRSLIWNKRRAMGQSGIYMTEDFASDVSRRRNKLRPILQAASRLSEFEHSISIRGDKLCLNGKLYSVDKLHDIPAPINPKTLSEKRFQRVLVFGGINSEYHELSNFYQCRFTFRNIVFNCVEQSYQYFKAIMFGDQRTARLILTSRSPSRQKYLATHELRNFDKPRWLAHRDELMKDIIHSKFSQNQDLADRLLATDTFHIGEAIQKDLYWGTGVSVGHKNATLRKHWNGQNNLGKLLMEERKQLRGR